MITNTKKCSACGQAKPLDEFYRDRAKPGGWKHQCKSCVARGSTKSNQKRGDMLHMHVAGELIKAPATKTAANGKPFTVLVLKADVGKDVSQIITALCFGDLHDEAQTMARGDSVSFTGKATLGTWEREGTVTASLSVVVSALLSGRKAQTARHTQTTWESTAAAVPSTQRSTQTPAATYGRHVDDVF